MEKRNNQLEHGQPIEPTGGLFCTWDSGVARCQSQYQYHFWRTARIYALFRAKRPGCLVSLFSDTSSVRVGLSLCIVL